MALKASGSLAILALAGIAVVGCSESETKKAANNAVSSASSVASNASTAVSSAASSASTAVSSAVSSALAPTTTLEAPGVGPVVLEGPIAEAFTKAGGQEKVGLPTAKAEKVGDGTAQPFVQGTIFWSPATGAHLIQGEILKVYKEHGGPAGALGFPTADEKETAGGPDVVKGGWISEFQKGVITWVNEGEGKFKETVTPK